MDAGKAWQKFCQQIRNGEDTLIILYTGPEGGALLGLWVQNEEQFATVIQWRDEEAIKYVTAHLAQAVRL